VIDQALAYVAQADSELHAALQSTRHCFNVRPPSQEWSVAQVLGHLIRTERVYQLIWTLAPPLSRLPRLLEALDRLDIRLWHSMGLRTIIEAPGTVLVPENATTGKFAAPPILKPGPGGRFDSMLETRHRVRARSLRIIDRLSPRDLAEVRWSHPLFGKYTMLEWVEMMGTHDRRHTGQILRIAAAAA
jgi:uncharacterized damage-inducible protein DinB